MRLPSLVALVVLPFLIGSAGPPPVSTTAPADDGRVILLGFDGADARTVDLLLEQYPDRYPAFRKLKAEGTFAPLEVVAPPESPVSWAALNTGQNPAKTGVPGFVRRDNGTGDSAPFPTLGHIKMESVPLAAIDNTPVPKMSVMTTALMCGGGIFFVVALICMILLRGKIVVSVLIAAVVGGGAAYAGAHVRGLLPEKFPRTSNPNRAENVWDYAARAGVKCVVIDPAQAFDMPTPDGAEVLWGLGIPDATNDLGQWAIYTTDPDEFDPPPKGRLKNKNGGLTAGRVFRVDERDGRIQTRVFGPKDFWKQPRLEAERDELKAKLDDPDFDPNKAMKVSDRYRDLKDEVAELAVEGITLPMEIELLADSARITIGEETKELKEGEWSDFYSLEFELNWLIQVHAITRVKLVSLHEPYFKLFVNVLDIDPRQPPFWQPISAPAEFAATLEGRCGLYETYGWSTATMPFKDREVDPELLMEDVEFTMKWRENLVYDQLGRDDWKFFMGVFSTTDRVQHMMYQYWDEEHPQHDAAIADREMTFFGQTIRMRDAIPAIYEQMDRIVGKVLADYVRPNDTLLVCSDHGFQSCRHQVNINNWLHEKGYLALRSSINKNNNSGLAFVDWDNTTAYSLGMGFIYLNLRGREFKGQVKLEDLDATVQRLKQDLLAEDFVHEVYVTKEIHDGPHLDMESDLIVGFAPLYRVSWGGTSGGLAIVKDDLGLYVPGPVIEDNDSPWSGGHVSVALPDVAGVFFSNRHVEVPAEGLKALQLAPTVLDLVGVAVPPEMDLGPMTIR